MPIPANHHKKALKLDESEPGKMVHPSMVDQKNFSAIRETENALILTLPASRREDRMNFTRNGFLPLLIYGFIAVYLIQIGSDSEPAGIIFGGLLGIYVAAKFLYITLNLIIGKEVLEITQKSITVSYGLGFFRRSQKYEAGRVKRMRYDETVFYQPTPIMPPKNGSQRWESVVDTSSYAILCDYNGETISLFGWVDKTLAKHLVSRIRDRFPAYR